MSEGTDPTGGVNQEPKEDKLFSQSELNAIIQDRVKRESQKYADYEDVKKQLESLQAKQKEREEAELSEVEKAVAKAKSLESKLAEVNAEAEKYKSQVSEWELEQSAAVEEAMKDLTDEQKEIVNELPLSRRMKAVNTFKASKPSPGSWGKGLNPEHLTLKAIMDKKSKGDPSWIKDYQNFRNKS